MTREMNKPDWHREWYAQNTVERMAKMMCRCDYNSYRVLDDWIRPFIDELKVAIYHLVVVKTVFSK